MENTINIDDISAHRTKRTGGPHTEDAQKRSSADSLKHAIYAKVALPPGELEQFDELHNAMIDDFKPSGPTKKFLVRRLAETQWRAGRILNAETNAILKAQEKGEPIDKAIERFGKYSSQLTRELQLLLKALKEHQDARYDRLGQEFRQGDQYLTGDKFVFPKESQVLATTKHQEERYLRKSL